MNEKMTRVFYVSPNSGLFDKMLDDACRLLGNLATDGIFNPLDINDAVELRQCNRLFEDRDRSVPGKGAEYSRLEKLSKQANGAAITFVSQSLERDPLGGLVGELEPELVEPFFETLGLRGIRERIREGELRTLLTDRPDLMAYVLAQRTLITEYDDLLRAIFLSEKVASAELIINTQALAGRNGSPLTLPTLSDDDVSSIIDAYCDYDRAHANKLQVISNWKGYGGYTLHPQVRRKAARRAEELGRGLLSSSTALTVAWGTNVRLDSKQKACVKLSCSGLEITYSYSSQWLERFTDDASILTNLIYVFGVISPWGNLTIATPDHSAGTFEKVLIPHGKSDMQIGHALHLRRDQIVTSIQCYEDLLVRGGTSLEHAVEWFFNSYVRDEFSIEGFRADIPDPSQSYVSRCVALSTEVERVSKEYHLYARDGKIDHALYEYESFPGFGKIASLLGQKYAYGRGEGFESFTAIMFSDSPLSYLPERTSKARCLYDRLVEGVTLSDYEGLPEFEKLTWLIDSNYLHEGKDGFLLLTPRGEVARALWEEGGIALRTCADDFKETLAEGHAEGWVGYGSSLLSEDEARIFDFVLNNSTYGNSLGLRNKYAHGAPPADDPNSNEFRRDYLHLMSCMLMLVLKMNDELSTWSGHVGQLEFVDWPLYEFDEIDTTANSETPLPREGVE